MLLDAGRRRVVVEDDDVDVVSLVALVQLLDTGLEVPYPLRDSVSLGDGAGEPGAGPRRRVEREVEEAVLDVVREVAHLLHPGLHDVVARGGLGMGRRHLEEGLHHLQLVADEVYLLGDPDEARDLIGDRRTGAAYDAVQNGPRQAQGGGLHLVYGRVSY